MNGVAGLTPARPVARKIQELARPIDGEDEDATDRRRLEGPDAWDGLEARPESEEFRTWGMVSRHGLRPMFPPTRTGTDGGTCWYDLDMWTPTSPRPQVEAEV